jgi:hypothetical protein
MAQNTLSVPSFPFFHRAFQQHILDGCLGRQIAEVGRIMDIAKLKDCQYDDGVASCGDPATVYDLETELEYCPKHFRRVSLDGALRKLEVNRG